MLRWSLKNLLTEPLRLFTSALGVASAFTLVIFFYAVFKGESEQIVAYPKHTDADVWVMQDGVSNMHMASSLLWDWKQTRVARIEGVAEVSSILYLNTVVSAGGKKWFSYVVGLDEDMSRGGPWEMAEGKALPAAGEAVIPEVMARLTGIGIGDPISITDKELRVVGLSRGSFSMANSVCFVSKTDLEDIMNTGGSVSYILVKAKPGVDPGELAQRINAGVEKVNALPAGEFVRRDREMAMQMGTEIIRMMTIIGALLALLIVAFTAYQQVTGKQRELAIAKAIGFRNRHIYVSAVFQTFVLTVLGLLISIVVSYTLIPLVPALAPQISVSISHEAFTRVGLAAILVAGLAALWPARKVAAVDPMSVFRD